MRGKVTIFVLLFITIISLLFNVLLSTKLFQKTSRSTSGNLTSAKVTRVIDGDTFDTDDGTRIRLYEINAPEYPKDCMGVDAKTRLEELIADKSVEIAKIKKDNFGRFLAFVYVDKLLVNELLVEEGLAYFVKDKSSSPYSLQIEQTQEKAKLAGRGVWSSLCQTKKDGCIIKGNYRSADNTRIYHTPDCYNYEKTTVKPGTSDRWFCTEKEAMALGFRKSNDCPR